MKSKKVKSLIKEKTIKRTKNNHYKLKMNKKRKFTAKSNKEIFFSDFKDENKISSNILNKLEKNSTKKFRRGENRSKSASNFLNLKQQKYSTISNTKINSFHKNLTFTKKCYKKKRKQSKDSYEKIKRKKIKSSTFIDFKFDKTILCDIVNKKRENKFKENIMDILAMDKVLQN